VNLSEHRKAIHRLDEIKAGIETLGKGFGCVNFTMHSQNNCEFKIAIPQETAHEIVSDRIACMVAEFNGLAKALRVEDGLDYSSTIHRFKKDSPND
jgi:hypothetical protein